jgi:DNA-binding MarR family transcriptional regulator
MTGKLSTQVNKGTGAGALEQEVFLNILRAADHLTHGLSEFLKPFNLSPTQYNVLRILRGATEQEGLACGEIAGRMLTRDPDITRLLDRLESRTLVTRCRQSCDRRVIKTCITPEGLKLLKLINEPILELHVKQLAHLDSAKLEQLAELIELVVEPKPC